MEIVTILFIIWCSCNSRLTSSLTSEPSGDPQALKVLSVAERFGDPTLLTKFYPKVEAEARIQGGGSNGYYFTTQAPNTHTSGYLQVVDRRDPHTGSTGYRRDHESGYSNPNQNQRTSYHGSYQNNYYQRESYQNDPYKRDSYHRHFYKKDNYYNSNSNYQKYNYPDYPKYHSSNYPDYPGSYYGTGYPGYSGFGPQNYGYGQGPYGGSPAAYPSGNGYPGGNGYPVPGFPGGPPGPVKIQNFGLSYENDYGWVSANVAPGQGYQVNFGVNPHLCYGLGLRSCAGYLAKKGPNLNRYAASESSPDFKSETRLSNR